MKSRELKEAIILAATRAAMIKSSVDVYQVGSEYRVKDTSARKSGTFEKRATYEKETVIILDKNGKKESTIDAKPHKAIKKPNPAPKETKE